jgi:hypothetical protein
MTPRQGVEIQVKQSPQIQTSDSLPLNQAVGSSSLPRLTSFWELPKSGFCTKSGCHFARSTDNLIVLFPLSKITRFEKPVILT